MLLISCEKHDTDSDSPNINEYDMKSMFYPTFVYPNTTKVKIIYNKENKISHRIGNLIPTSMMYKFYEYIGDTVVYYKDSIIVKKYLLSNKDFTSMDSYQRKLLLKDGQIVKEIHKRDYYDYHDDFDTIIYHYNAHRQIDQTTRLKRTTKEFSDYKYDDNGNLNLIVSKIYLKDYNDNIQIAYYDTTWFQGYDNSPNLAKNLIIFQECFYRALSTNNFEEYLYKRYRSDDLTLLTTENRNWKFTYDENNNPIY
jgi:hypothetical protein